MNTELLRLLLLTPNLHAGLTIWLRACEDVPHFPAALRVVGKYDRDMILDLCLLSTIDFSIEKESIRKAISTETCAAANKLFSYATDKEAIDAIVQDPVCCFVTLLIIEQVLDTVLEKHSEQRMPFLVAKETIYEYWNNVKFPDTEEMFTQKELDDCDKRKD